MPRRASVALERRSQRIFGDARQASAVHDTIYRQRTLERLPRRCDGIVAAKDELFQNVPLGGKAQALVLLPRPVEVGRYVSVDVRMLANDGDGVRVPGM